MQTTSHILMVRPVNFSYNPETAVNNAFQTESKGKNIQTGALREFDSLVTMLKNNGIDVTVVEDTSDPYTPDSIFPNNWLSFHDDGTLLLYPMYAVNRRLERKENVLSAINKKFKIQNKIDLSAYEKDGFFLEGTGSMVLDRDNKIAYACFSPRTNEKVLNDFCSKMNYTAVPFTAVDRNGVAIYHTNVMMCIADRYAVICLTAINDKTEKERVTAVIKKTNKEIIDISLEQVNHFAGNMLQVTNNKNEKLVIMSSQAFESLTTEQKTKLGSFNKIIHCSLTTIETNGGGSARCMIAEVFLPLS